MPRYMYSLNTSFRSNLPILLYVQQGGFGGYHAELVAERTAQNQGGGPYYPMLADFHSAVMTGAEAETGGIWAGVGQRSHTYGSMTDPYYDDSEQTDAYPGAIGGSGTSFAFYWSHPGDDDAIGQ